MQIGNLVLQITESTGAGGLTLTGVSGWRTLAAAFPSGSFFYFIRHKSAAEWEVGTGSLDSSGTLLQRDTILASSNSNAAVNFSAGVKEVTNDIPASLQVILSGGFVPDSNISESSVLQHEAALNIVAAQVTDFDVGVSSNTDVAANTAARHNPVTVVDTSSVDLALTGQQLSATVIPGGITHNNLSGLTTGDPHTQYLLKAAPTGFNLIIGQSGETISTGIAADVVIPFAATITGYTALADQTGSIQVDIWKDSFANYPPTDEDSITASAPIALSSAVKAQDATLTGWTTNISAGDALRFYVDSVTSIETLSILIELQRT